MATYHKDKIYQLMKETQFMDDDIERVRKSTTRKTYGRGRLADAATQGIGEEDEDEEDDRDTSAAKT
eukprot:2206805-Amphidinium_carterae.1